MAEQDFDKKAVVALLNEILETELAGVVRYTHYSLMIFGHNRIPIVSWLRGEATPGRTLAVFATLGDKDAAGVASALDGLVDAWHLAGLEDAGPRGLDVDAFAAHLAGSPAADGTRHRTVQAALAAALAEAAPGDRVLVFGSFHTAAAAIRGLAV